MFSSKDSVSLASRHDEESEPETLVELLRRRAERHPDKSAYVFLTDGLSGEVKITYGDLDRRARAIGNWLSSVGASRQRVLLLYPSGLEYVAAFFGCLYAGAVAVPAYPPRPNQSVNRINAIVKDALPMIALTTSSIASGIEATLGQQAGLNLRVQASDLIRDEFGENWQSSDINGETIAFLQYTSGSTATPKGVIVNHRNLIENERTICEAFRQNEESIIVGWLPLFHDMGLIGQVLQPLYVGARCILISPSTFLQRPSTWLETISRYRATTSGGPNFAYDLCVRRITRETRETLDLSSWSVAFNGSEPVQEQTLDRFTEAFEPCGFRRKAFFPCYGLAEATLFVAGGKKMEGPRIQPVRRTSLEEGVVVPASDGDKDSRVLVSCGQGVSDQSVIIVDPDTRRRRSNGQVGEIWISGESVAQGYWNRNEESKLTFQAHLADTGEGPFLRSNDLGFIYDGQLYVTGRLKDLIIIRGRNHYSEDLEQTVEKSHRALRAGGAAAFSVEIAGEERLVIVQEMRPGYPDRKEIVGAIRQSVAEEHDLEVYAVVLSPPGGVPRTSSGKIQRRACRAEFLARTLRLIEVDVIDDSSFVDDLARLGTFPGKEQMATVSELERHGAVACRLQREIAMVLNRNISQVPLEQPLIRLGVDSLKAVEIQNRLESVLNVPLPMATLLGCASIFHLASFVERTSIRHGEPSLQIAHIESDAGLPLSPGQHRLWFLDQMEPGDASNNISAQFRLTGSTNVVALEQAIREIVSRHQTLRTVFSGLNGDPRQIVSAAMAPVIRVVDLSSVAQEFQPADFSDLINGDLNRAFDLAQGPLFRLAALKLTEREHIFLFSVHHIVFDGWSLGVMLREMKSLYESYAAGNFSPLSELSIQYIDFAIWQRQLLEGEAVRSQLSYWKAKFAVPAPRLDLSADKRRFTRRTNRGSMRRFDVSFSCTEHLEALGRESNSTMFMTLVAAFAALIHCLTDEKDIVIGTPVAGRNRSEFEKLIGFFVNTLALRFDLSGNPTFRGLLDRVRGVALEAYAHADLPFERLVAEVNPGRELGRSALYQVWFVLHQAPIPDIDLPDLKMRPIETELQMTKFDLALNMVQTPKGLDGGFEFSLDLLDAATVASFADDFDTVLNQVTEDPDISLRALRQAVSRKRLTGRHSEREISFRQKLRTSRRQ
jgi:acyl-CoA synthetase (AMP-forming)/AMP-acid ligase II/acyl carrier protein